MSKDAMVTKKLIEVLEDGRKGFAEGADKLRSLDRPDLAAMFDRHAQQRQQFSADLEAMAAAYGDDIDEDGSFAAAVHRGWMSLKDAISGSDPDGVLGAAVQGEDHAVETYDKALSEDISADLRTTVQSQLADITTARNEVKAQHDATD
ncbi:ferritin-like domain-containing protein [Ilumatobacter nonamiensis]|uniref:ferritin-like domain-containing protein n=1 Tax=Ilumatobacter nonamiensis TaxID=467093 RepID=UPI00058F805E|nr:PA2169 family four-helix-bundle protein [Ilumatobacter nonamiensis]